MVSSTEKQILTINIFSQISKSKGKQTIKFEIEYKVKNVFVQ